MSELEKAFLKFANYGNTSTTGSDMTDKNFSKMCQECGVMDGKAVNSDDVAIAFNKVKATGARTINYIQFLQAIKVLCGKRFSRKLSEDALQATFKLLEGREPANVETTKSVARRVERLTDTSEYMNSNMQHFDKSGKDDGVAGHTDLSQRTSNISNYRGSGT
ncbi:tubulin polymerization-promoting protein family member 2-like [Heteronotia binoei]|uniref:tubulin polymerization-promoting protein family member 2-like n=1 Tax=Heteronotia binoei TaxID=13085 RepID=UPI00292E97E9|nr:tubulin polymerization-promoting protein family member 2-like [Heteronotia binoei]